MSLLSSLIYIFHLFFSRITDHTSECCIQCAMESKDDAYLIYDRSPSFNPLTPNDPYTGRTAPLTSKVAFYIFIQQI